MVGEIVNLLSIRQNGGSMALRRVLDNDTNVKSDYYFATRGISLDNWYSKDRTGIASFL